jgi:transposase-like protein
MKCPRCQANKKQYKAGFNPSGSQRYRCGECNRVYTPEPKPRGYSSEMRMLAMRLYMEGNSQRAIGRILKIGQQTVANWIDDYVDRLPPAPVPEKPQEAELDELYTFLKQKKTQSTSRRS